MQMLLLSIPFVLAACCGGRTPREEPAPAVTTTTNPPASTPAPPASSAAAPAVSLPTYKDLGDHFMMGQTEGNVLVAPGLTEAQVTALARHLHQQKPGLLIHLFDDDKEFEAYRLWAEHNLKKKNPRYPYPEKWAAVHDVGTIKQVLAPGGGRWQLAWYPKGIGSLEPKMIPLDS